MTEEASWKEVEAELAVVSAVAVPTTMGKDVADTVRTSDSLEVTGAGIPSSIGGMGQCRPRHPLPVWSCLPGGMTKGPGRAAVRVAIVARMRGRTLLTGAMVLVGLYTTR